MDQLGVSQTPTQQDQNLRKALKWSLFLLSITLMALGSGGQLLTRVYFMHGGKRLWLSSLLQICGWPLALIPLSITYIHRCRRMGPSKAKIFLATPRIVIACAALGVVTGLGCYLYAYGSSYLPVSTSSLLSSTQLAFTALFAFLIVKQKFTAYSINSVVLLLLGAAILGTRSSGDRPAGESDASYYLGFFMMLAAAALFGVLLPFIELTYLKIKQEITFSLVMEMQVLMAIFASVFCIVGMLVNMDFQAIPREAREFGLGEVKYYIVLVATAIFWQIANLGFVGIISCSSSLLAAVVTAVLLPIGEIFAVILLHEMFDSGKGVALALSLWGFASYLYGEWRQYKKKKGCTAVELPAVP